MASASIASTASTAPTTTTGLLTRAVFEEKARKFLQTKKSSNTAFLAKLKAEVSDMIDDNLTEEGPENLLVEVDLFSLRIEIERDGMKFVGDGKEYTDEAWDTLNNFAHELRLDIGINGNLIRIKIKDTDPVLVSESESDSESDYGSG
jgi:hypothetical protein